MAKSEPAGKRTNKERERETVSENKSGDHVFNKGVKTICFDIIEKYFKDKKNTSFRDSVTKTDTPRLYEIMKDRYWPLPKETVDLIDLMKVSSKRKDKPDDNSVLFGEGKRCLVETVISTLNQVISEISKYEENDVLTPQLNEFREDLKKYVKNYYTHEGGVSRGDDGFYVDPEAKKRWIEQTKNTNEQFEQCRDAVREIFRKLVGAEEKNPKEWLIYILAKEILHLENLKA